MRFYPSAVRALVLSSFAFVGSLVAQQVNLSRPMIVQRVDESALTTLKGNIRPEARAANDRGSVASSFAMPGMRLVLKRSPEQQAAIDAYAQSVQDTASPNYHHFLTATQQGATFGPAQTDIEAITNWLVNHGFTVDSVAQNGMSIEFTGTAGLVQSAFHTEIHNLDVKGVMHVANMTDPQIPAALAPAVVGIQSLHNFFMKPLHTMGSQVKRTTDGKWQRISDDGSPKAAISPLFGSGGTSGGQPNVQDVAPYDFAAIYNVLPLWSASTPIDGTGQTIAVVGTSDINPADVTAFRAAFGLPAYAAAMGSTPGFSVIHPNTAPGACTSKSNSCLGDLEENSLDVEWAGAVAKNASIILVASSAAAGNTYSADAVYIGANYIVQNNVAPIVNVSYGECELGFGTAGNAGWNTLWQTASVSGIAVFVASGDQSSALCDAGYDTTNPYGAKYGLSVSGLASTPYNVAVGGTDFNWGWINGGEATYWNTTNNATTLASAKGYIPESPWNNNCTNANLDAALNTGLGTSDNATTICNKTALGTYNSIFGSSAPYLLDIIGGSGGVSGCTTNDTSATGTTIGDVSSCSGGYAKPSWQTGVTGIPSDGKRDVPDISFFATNGFSGSAYVICVSALGSCTYNATTEPTAQEVGGTSVSSPIMASVMALINQKANANQGQPNAALYKLAAKQTYSNCSTESVTNASSCYFNDIDTGNNTVPCTPGSPNCSATTATATAPYGILTGYNSTAGYDFTSGLGSLNIANVVNSFTAATTPSVSLSSSTLNFASTTVNTTSAAQTITLTNSSSVALTVSGVSISGTNATSFAQTNTCTSVAAFGTCTINVTFSPTAAASYAATINIADNATGSPQTVALTGTGVVTSPTVTLSTAALTFAATNVGSTSAAQTVTVTNSGNAALTVSAVALTGVGSSSFSQTNNCTSVAAGSTCAIMITFTPQSAGSISAAVSITDNATGSPQSVTLTGTGVAVAPAVTLSPSSLTFASMVGATSSAQNITVTNSGNTTLTVSGVIVMGTNASSFAETSTCSSVAAGSNCSISVTFKPTVAGTLTASISIADNATGSPQTVALTGTATAAVTPGTYTLSAAAASVTHGSSTTSAITATGANSYAGTITLKSCTLATSPTNATSVPTCTVTTPTITIASGSTTGTGGVVTISTTAATTSMLRHDFDQKTWTGAAGVALAGALFLFIPRKRRTWGMLLSIVFLVGTLGVMSGCGGSSSPTGSSGTTTGAYTFTITGTDTNSTSVTTTLNVTVN